MTHQSLQIIRDEHAALAAMLRSLSMMVERGPGDDPAAYFDVLRAMLFYIDEFPEKQHHPKEGALLFPPIAARDPAVAKTIATLDAQHARTETWVRELQHMLLAWEWLGDSRRAAFEKAARDYVAYYLDHMRMEEVEVLPSAEHHLSESDWKALDEAFAQNRDPLSGKYPADPAFDRLFTRIVMKAPAPIGLGPSTNT